MAAFVVSCDRSLPVAEAWRRVTDWPRHGEHVPLTAVRVPTAGPTRVGTVFVAHTGLGPVGFDDPMEIVLWQPPDGGTAGYCRIEKRGRVMLGWAELSVEPHGDGSRTTWREDASPAHLPRFTAPASALAGRLLFGGVLAKLLDRPV